MTTLYAHCPSPLGTLTLIGERDGAGAVRLSGLHLPEDRFGRPIEPGWIEDPGAFTAVLDGLGSYFAGDPRPFEVPLALDGTAFQRRVWAELASIPFGATVSYGALAARLGSPKASRAVGAAVGRNPVAIVLPCHRVVGSDGNLTGYAGGLERKAWLLDHERSAAERAAVASRVA